MPSPYGFNDYGSGNEDILSLFNRYNREVQPYDIPSYLDPSDPDVLKLRDLYSQPSGASGLVSSYVESRPDFEEYKPSFGRRLAGTLLGAFSKDPYGSAQSFTQQPYLSAYQEWKDKGNWIDDQSRLLEADKAREVKAVEFGLRQKNLNAQREATQKDKARAIAGGLTRTEDLSKDRETALNFRKEQEAFDQRVSNQKLTDEASRLEIARKRLELEGLRTRKTKPVDPMELEVKRTAQKDKLREATKAEVTSDPKFRNYFERNAAGKIDFKADLDDKVKRDILDYIEGQFQRKLAILGTKTVGETSSSPLPDYMEDQ